MKKILMIFFIILSIIGVSFLSSCEDDNDPYKEEGYYKYYYDDDTAYVVGLTELGMEQEVLDFTAKLDGKNIVLGYKYRLNNGTELKLDIESENLKKIYLNDGNFYYFISIRLYNKLNLNKVLFSGDYSKKANKGDSSTPLYFPIYFKTNVELSDKNGNISEYHQFYANVEYNLNYDDNDIYFIDDYDNELISYIPQNPKRKGYTFDGWYKESECINKWDFSLDIIKEKKWLNDNRECYKDQDYEKTTLYAKWI